MIDIKFIITIFLVFIVLFGTKARNQKDILMAKCSFVKLTLSAITQRIKFITYGTIHFINDANELLIA